MAGEKKTNQKSSSDQAKAMNAGTQPPRGDLKAQRGSMQADQISGQTQKGAHNQEMKNRNPQGNKPKQNKSARQKGKTF